MTAHELARCLLTLPDDPVICSMNDETSGRIVVQEVEAVVPCLVGDRSLVEIGGRWFAERMAAGEQP